MAKKYKVKLHNVNGQESREGTLTIGEQTTDKNGMLQQKLTFDDTDIVIKEIEENDSHRVVIDSTLHSDYIVHLLDVRAKSGNATQLEKVAHYQLEHMRSAEAEQLDRLFPKVDSDLDFNDVQQTSKWKNRKSDSSYKKLSLSHEQITGKQPLPDLDKEFPWRIEKDPLLERIGTKIFGFDIENQKGSNASKQEILETLRNTKYCISDDMIKDRTSRAPEQDKDSMFMRMRYDFALQNAKDKLGIETPDDEGTERLVAAAKTRENGKKGKSASERTTFTPIKQDKDFDMG